jgi:hypothetical protein
VLFNETSLSVIVESLISEHWLVKLKKVNPEHPFVNKHWQTQVFMVWFASNEVLLLYAKPIEK